MKRRFLLLFVLCFSAPGAKKNAPKPPDLELIDSSAHVEENKINIDGHIRNVSAKAIRKPVVFYEILDSDQKVLTRQQGEIEQEVLPAGADEGFHAQIAYHARSVSFRLEFEDGAGHELRVAKSGPFPIE